MDGMTLVREAHAAGLSIRADGDKLVIQGPQHAEPVVRQLVAHKPAVLAALRAMWDSIVAEAMIQDTLARISRMYDRFAPGCPVDGPGWDEAEALVCAAYSVRSLNSLQEALASYQRHAKESFMEWQARGHERPACHYLFRISEEVKHENTWQRKG